MKENQVKQIKKMYISPAARVFRMETSAQIMDTSFPGQHNPGHHGSGPGANPAKGGFLDEEDEAGELAEADLWGKPWK